MEGAKEARSKELEKARYEKRKAYVGGIGTAGSPQNPEENHKEKTGTANRNQPGRSGRTCKKSGRMLPKPPRNLGRKCMRKPPPKKQGCIVKKSKLLDFPTNADYYGIPLTSISFFEYHKQDRFRDSGMI